MKKFIFVVLFIATFFCCYAENTITEENLFKGTWEYVDDYGDIYGFQFNNKYVLLYEIYVYEDEIEKEIDDILPYVHDENFVIIFDEEYNDKIYGYIENSFLFIDGDKYTKVKKEENVFPKLFTCPYCSTTIKVTKSGRFRCVGCKSIINVNDQGQIKLEN